MLDVFDVRPDGPLDRLQAYWYATLCRVAYLPDPQQELAALADMAGGSLFGFFPSTDPLVRGLAVLSFPGARGVVCIVGTNQAVEYLAQAAGSVLTQANPWPGSVGFFWQRVARETWHEAIELIVPLGGWIATGHSMGGGVAAMMPFLATPSPLAIVDFGSVRTGDAGHAAAQTTPRLRITNQGDPVPLLPLSTNTFLDQTPIILQEIFFPFNVPIPYPPLYYRHWGSRVHLWLEGDSSRPVETWTPSEVLQLASFPVNQGIDANHRMAEYARRLRAGIPVSFPAQAADVDYPEVENLDHINNILNIAAEVTWWFTPIGGAARNIPTFPPLGVDPCAIGGARTVPPPPPPPPPWITASTTSAPSSGTNEVLGGGATSWSNPANVLTENGSLATANLSNPRTQRLRAANYAALAFLGSVQEILGIVVRIKRKQTQEIGQCRDFEVRLLRAGAVAGDEKGTATIWPTVLTDAVYGGTNDLWGMTDLTPADFTDDTFGVAFRAERASPDTTRADCDFIEVTVHYRYQE